MQPLLFAVQSALTAGLAECGLHPDMVLGHSLGEVAAAEAAGALTLDQAVHVIFHRSAQQECGARLGRHGGGQHLARGRRGPVRRARPGRSGNRRDQRPRLGERSPARSPRSDAFARLARKRRIAARVLELPYPFHCSLLEPLRQPLLKAFGTITPSAGTTPFISTVDRRRDPGRGPRRAYWWRNVREPVLFGDAIETAGRRGATVFIEIGPRPILHSQHRRYAPRSRAGRHDRAEPGARKDAIRRSADCGAARAVVLGCKVDAERVFGARPAGRVCLPPYAWQRKTYQQPQTSEAMDLCGSMPRHPLIGARLRAGTPEWRNLIDATIVPYLSTTASMARSSLPASAFAEMALAVAPHDLSRRARSAWRISTCCTGCRCAPERCANCPCACMATPHVVEIWSRPRFGADEWTLHARGRIAPIASPVPAFVARTLAAE